MKNRDKAIVVIGATVVLCVCTTVYANDTIMNKEKKDSSNVVNVQNIKWHVPNEFKEPDTVVQYDITIEEAEYQFNPEAYIETADDNLINYAAPAMNGWSNVSANYIDYDAPDFEYNSKTYMRFQKLGYNAGNKQSALCRGASAYTGDYCIRMVEGRYLVALGTHYTSTIGQYVDIQLEDGTVLPCILGDVKSDTHTDETHSYQKWDKSVMEFIVDSPVLNQGDGDYDYLYSNVGVIGNFSNIDLFSAKVKTIRVYDTVFPITLGDTSSDNPDRY